MDQKTGCALIAVVAGVIGILLAMFAYPQYRVVSDGRLKLADLPLSEKAQADHDEKIEHDRADKSSSHSHPPFLGVCPAEGRNNRFHPEKSGLKYIKKTQK